MLPITDPVHRITLGEGGTPLLECPRLAARLGVRRLLVKFEGTNPTGTVKDRTAATAVAAALQFGFRATSVVSSGNAGSAIAAYSARAGLRSLVFAYERASAPKILHMATTATDFVLYRGVYDDLIGLWDRLVEERLFFDCGASRNAYKHEGKKTLAYEIAEQTGWRPPDVVVAPVAVGETFIAVARGFRELMEMGWIDRVPLMVAAQATRANAVTRRLAGGHGGAPAEDRLYGGRGARRRRSRTQGRQWTLRLLREMKGVAGDAEDDEILAAQRTLARTEGIWAGPTGVAALAVLEKLLAAKILDPAQTICVIVSETGLKTEAEPPSRAVGRLRLRHAQAAGDRAPRPLGACPEHDRGAPRLRRGAPSAGGFGGPCRGPPCRHAPAPAVLSAAGVAGGARSAGLHPGLPPRPHADRRSDRRDGSVSGPRGRRLSRRVPPRQPRALLRRRRLRLRLPELRRAPLPERHRRRGGCRRLRAPARAGARRRSPGDVATTGRPRRLAHAWPAGPAISPGRSASRRGPAAPISPAAR